MFLIQELTEWEKMKPFQLIIRAGGYVQNAYEFGGVLSKTLPMKQMYWQRKIGYVYDDCLNKPQNREIMNQINSLLSQLEQMLSSKLVTEFDLELIEANPALNAI